MGFSNIFKKADTIKREMPKICACCEKAMTLKDRGHVLCSKRGIVDADHCCRRFRYDPLKRIPAKHAPITAFEPNAAVEVLPDSIFIKKPDAAPAAQTGDPPEKEASGEKSGGHPRV